MSSSVLVLCIWPLAFTGLDAQFDLLQNSFRAVESHPILTRPLFSPYDSFELSTVLKHRNRVAWTQPRTSGLAGQGEHRLFQQREVRVPHLRPVLRLNRSRSSYDLREFSHRSTYFRH